MNWYITGNKGFIGTRLTEILGCPGADREERDILPLQVAIVHLAAESGIIPCEENPSGAVGDNIDYLQTILELAGATKSSIVFASSAAADNPSNVYGATKLIGEALIKQWHKKTGLPYWILRLGNVYGPGSDNKSSVVAAWCKAIKAGNAIRIHGNGLQERGFIHVDDVCKAIVEVVNHPTGTYRVGGPLLALCEVTRCMNNRISLKVEYEDPRFPKPDPVPPVPNWKPTIPLEEGIAETMEYFGL